MRLLEPADVMAAAAELAGGSLEALGTVDLPGLEAALGRVRHAGPSNGPEAAALTFVELTRTRPFSGGNLRIAWLASCQLLSMNGLESPASEELAEVLVDAAERADHERLAAWIRAHCAVPTRQMGTRGMVMFERFSDDGREVIHRAREEAMLLHHDFVGTEHLLLALAEQEHSPASATLARSGVTPEAVRDAIRNHLGPSGDTVVGDPHFTPRTKKVLELSLREAVGMKSRRITAGHILLGLIREGTGLAAQVMKDLGVDLKALRKILTQAMSEEASSTISIAPRLERVDVEALRQRMLSDFDTLTSRIRDMEAEADRLRSILRKHGIDPDSGERSA